MTWDEFKAKVDRQLAEMGLTGSVVVDWIDWPDDWDTDGPEVICYEESIAIQ